MRAWLIKAVLLLIGTAMLFPLPIRADEEFVFIVRDGDSARTVTERYLVRPTAWDRVVQYNYILKPGNVIRVPVELVRKTGAAFIASFYGDVQVKSASYPAWEPAPPGLILRDGDSVKTGLDSGVVLVMGEGGEAILRGETEVIYQPYSRILTGWVNRLDILKGEVEAIIPLKSDRRADYEIVTPDSRLSLKGTRLRVKVEDRVGTHLEVLEGEVDTEFSGEKFVIKAGTGIVIGE